MKEKRKNIIPKSSFTSTQVGVLIEDFQSQFKVFGEKLVSMQDQLNTVIVNQGHMWEDIARINQRLNSIEQRLDTIEQRLAVLEQEVLEIKQEILRLKKEIIGNESKAACEINLRLEQFEKRLVVLESRIK